MSRLCSLECSRRNNYFMIFVNIVAEIYKCVNMQCADV